MCAPDEGKWLTVYFDEKGDGLNKGASGDDDIAVKVVPDFWVIDDKTNPSVLWPPYKTDARINAASFKREVPNENWTQTSVLTIKWDTAKETYSEAMEMMTICISGSSDLDKKYADAHDKRKRKSRARKTVSSSDEPPRKRRKSINKSIKPVSYEQNTKHLISELIQQLPDVPALNVQIKNHAKAKKKEKSLERKKKKVCKDTSGKPGERNVQEPEKHRHVKENEPKLVNKKPEVKITSVEEGTHNGKFPQFANFVPQRDRNLPMVKNVQQNKTSPKLDPPNDNGGNSEFAEGMFENDGFFPPYEENGLKAPNISDINRSNSSQKSCAKVNDHASKTLVKQSSLKSTDKRTAFGKNSGSFSKQLPAIESTDGMNCQDLQTLSDRMEQMERKMDILIANQDQIIKNQCKANIVGTATPDSDGISPEDKVMFLALFEDTKTDEKFTDFDKTLKQTPTLKAKLLRYMLVDLVDYNSWENSVRIILNTVMHNEVQQQYSCRGQKGKKALIKTTFYQVLEVAVKKVATADGKCTITTQKIQSYLSEYLKQAKNRGGGYESGKKKTAPASRSRTQESLVRSLLMPSGLGNKQKPPQKTFDNAKERRKGAGVSFNNEKRNASTEFNESSNRGQGALNNENRKVNRGNENDQSYEFDRRVEIEQNDSINGNKNDREDGDGHRANERNGVGKGKNSGFSERDRDGGGSKRERFNEGDSSDHDDEDSWNRRSWKSGEYNGSGNGVGVGEAGKSGLYNESDESDEDVKNDRNKNENEDYESDENVESRWDHKRSKRGKYDWHSESDKDSEDETEGEDEDEEEETGKKDNKQDRSDDDD